jgi:hypothetical protein
LADLSIHFHFVSSSMLIVSFPSETCFVMALGAAYFAGTLSGTVAVDRGVGSVIDVLGNRPHGTVGHQELGGTSVQTAEALDVGIESPGTGAHDRRGALVVLVLIAVIHAEHDRCPQQHAAEPMGSFADRDRFAGTVGDVPQADAF